jgi:hypothetical protein
MVDDEKTRLKALLTYWVEHNDEHTREFREWAEKATQMGAREVSKDLVKAVKNMEKVSETLSRTLLKL